MGVPNRDREGAGRAMSEARPVIVLRASVRFGIDRVEWLPDDVTACAMRAHSLTVVVLNSYFEVEYANIEYGMPRM